MARRALDVTGSILTTLLIFGATPAVLVVVVGDPLGDGLGHQWSERPRLLFAALALVAWIAWAVCCTQLARAVVEQVRHGHAGAPASAVLTDRVAAFIAAGLLSVMAFGSPIALSAAAGAAGPRTAVTVGSDAPTTMAAPAPTTAPPATGAPATLRAAPVAARQVTTPGTYVVRPGDTLWSIAQSISGDGDDWPAIAALNLGRTMADGLQFVDPNRIYAGWILEMPDQATPVSSDSAETALHPDSGPVDRSTPTTGLIGPWLPTALHADVPRRERPVSAGSSAEPFENEALVTADPDSLEAGKAAHQNLPELAALGIGALACAALFRRVRRTRLLRHLAAEENDPARAPSPHAIDAGILLARGAGLPALRAFESANYGLATLLADRSESPVRLRAICVGAAGVDFWLADAGRPAPDGLTLSSDGLVWHAAHGTFPEVSAGYPLLPIVLPVGEDDHGTWLLPLAPGDCLPLLGQDAAALWQAARPVQEAWSWADMVLVTDDPLVASAEALLRDERAQPDAGAAQVLYFGNPALLGDEVAQRVAIVTLTAGPASDVTVLVDRRGASIHPLGRTVRPHLMGSATSRLIGELVEPPVVDDAAEPGVSVLTDHPAPPSPSSPIASALGLRRPTASVTYSAAHPVPDIGTVEVRLLTSTPRLEGLRTALPPNRARRAVELVAYLALHAGQEVTSDRLRTRVLGSSDADAAAKTLFNIATAARRAMGLDASGTPLLPPGSRTGHYRVSDAVTTDVHRAAGLARAASSTEDPDIAMGLLRAALNLVEGEPMANVLSGYTWWDAEGHGARIAAVLVNAATDLAALAVEAELFELAQWGLEQARLVDPYSEALSRAAMQVAAAGGDGDRLRREWRDCQRRTDELDPGSTPSPRTERLYGELAQRVLIGARTATDL